MFSYHSFQHIDVKVPGFANVVLIIIICHKGLKFEEKKIIFVLPMFVFQVYLIFMEPFRLKSVYYFTVDARDSKDMVWLQG